MYKAYVKEKENLITHESEVGFGAYRINKFGKFFENGFKFSHIRDEVIYFYKNIME